MHVENSGLDSETNHWIFGSGSLVAMKLGFKGIKEPLPGPGGKKLNIGRSGFVNGVKFLVRFIPQNLGLIY